METASNSSYASNLINRFYKEIEKIGQSTALICQQNFNKTTVDQITSLHERYGIYTHNQGYLLLGNALPSITGQENWQKTTLILESILEDDSFQKASFYWSKVQRHTQYRFAQDLDNCQELRTIVRRALEIRLTEGHSEGRLILLSLGWLLWMQHSIPIIEKFGAGHQYYSYWLSAEYFTKFLPTLPQHTKLLAEAISHSPAIQIKQQKWWDKVALDAAADLREYNNLIFQPIIGNK